MNIDQPLCNLKTCRHCFDGNCINDQAFACCEYANAISELAYLAPLADLWEQRARKLADMYFTGDCYFCEKYIKKECLGLYFTSEPECMFSGCFTVWPGTFKELLERIDSLPIERKEQL